MFMHAVLGKGRDLHSSMFGYVTPMQSLIKNSPPANIYCQPENEKKQMYASRVLEVELVSDL
jgi:hypothetical protein